MNILPLSFLTMSWYSRVLISADITLLFLTQTSLTRPIVWFFSHGFHTQFSFCLLLLMLIVKLLTCLQFDCRCPYTLKVSFQCMTTTHTHYIACTCNHKEYNIFFFHFTSTNPSLITFRVRITRLLRVHIQAHKHLTWGCLIATQPQSLSVGATTSLLLSTKRLCLVFESENSLSSTSVVPSL